MLRTKNRPEDEEDGGIKANGKERRGKGGRWKTCFPATSGAQRRYELTAHRQIMGKDQGNGSRSCYFICSSEMSIAHVNEETVPYIQVIFQNRVCPVDIIILTRRLWFMSMNC